MRGGLPLEEPRKPFAEDMPGDTDCGMFLKRCVERKKETGKYDAWCVARRIQQHKRGR